ncbi:MAG: O-antigen ligase family protein [Clostridia bacterium]|nr:O-antigen ligase family protein [Clostridia bacterium]
MLKLQKENILKKLTFENILFVYIILQPIIDIITSLCVRNISPSLTLGMFIRSIFMVFLMIYTLVKVDKKSRYKILAYYGVIAIYCIYFIVNSYLRYNSTMLFVQIKGLVKTFYYPITLASILILFKNTNFHISSKAIYISLILYVLPIVICKYFSIGYNTYQFKENLGSIGLFYAGNEIAAIIAIIAPICFTRFILEEFNTLNFIVCIITVLAMLEIGTKVGFLAISSLLALTLIISFIRFIKDKKLYKHFISILSLVLITIMLLGNTSVGSNLKIKPLISINAQSSTKSKSKKSNKTYAEEVKESPDILLSGRNDFYKKAKQNYVQSSTKYKLLGLGYISEEEGSIIETKLVEIDYFDVFFCHGIIGTIIYLIPLAIILFTLIKKFFKNFITNMQNVKLIFILYSILIAFGIALMAGHIFTAPAVSMFLILNLLELFIILNKKEDLKYE